MKFEVGKFYKTRDGTKARVICVDRADDIYPIVALVQSVDMEECACLNSDGRVSANEDSPEDLVAEWTEPKPRMLAYLGLGGAITLRPATMVDFEKTSGCTRAPWLDEPEGK